MAYCRHHKVYARVKINGKWIHLGRYGTEESKEKFRRLVAEHARVPDADPDVSDETTIAELLAGYLDYAKQYYGDVPRGRYRNLLPIIRVVNQTYGSLPAREFTPKRLKAIRQIFIDNGNSRSYCNRNVQSIVAVVADGIPDELKQRPQWILWRHELRRQKDGSQKWAKVPKTTNGSNGKSNDPATWTTFNGAWTFCQLHKEKFDGIAYVFSIDDPYCGIDLDACRRREDGILTD